MEISLTHVQPVIQVAAFGADTTAGGEAAHAGDRAAYVQRNDMTAEQQEARTPGIQLVVQQTSADIARMVASQIAGSADARDAGATHSEDDPKTRAVRAYEESAQVQDEARALIDRVVLLPEPGDLSLEASRLQPYGRDEEKTAWT